MRTMTYVFVIMISFLVFTSCGNSYDELDYCPFAPFFEDRSLLYGETLTFIMPSLNPRQNQIVQRNVASFNRRWSRYNVFIDLNVIDDNTPDLSMFQLQVATEMMFGTMEALILLEGGYSHGRRGIDWRNPSISMFFADMWPVLNADPNFHEDNFFISIFDALTLNDGSLRVLTESVDVSFVMANRTISGLENSFHKFEYVSIEDLHKLHKTYVGCGSLYMFFAYSPARIASINAHEFLDMNNRTASFNNDRFIDKLIRSLDLTNPRQNEAMFNMFYVFDGIEAMDIAHSTHYAFKITRPLINIHQFFPLEGYESFFTAPLPQVNNRGELMISPLNPMALTTATTYAQRVIAWEFIKFVTCSERVIEIPISYSQSMSIYRPNLHSNIYWAVARWFPSSIGRTDVQPGFRNSSARATGFNLNITQDEAINALIDFHDNLAQMPMVLNHIMTRPMFYAIESNVRSLQDGLLLPSQAAANIQNTVMLILLEGN